MSLDALNVSTLSALGALKVSSLFGECKLFNLDTVVVRSEKLLQ